MTANIKASVASGNIEIITSKSYAHRLLIAAALTNEESVIEKVYLSDNVYRIGSEAFSKALNFKIIYIPRSSAFFT